MTDFVEVPCQVCGAPEGESVYQRDFDSVALGRARVCLRFCTDCGFLYTSPRPDQASLESHYRSSGFASGAVWRAHGAGSRHERFMRVRTRFVLAHVDSSSSAGSLLDVGAAQGDFLDAIELSGWRLVGLEPSHPAADKARAKGFSIVEETLESCRLQPESFDVVTCFSVLEHVWDVRESMHNLERLVRPGGTLVLYVPDSCRPTAQVSEFFSFEHLSHFTRGSLLRLLRNFGFRSVAVEQAEGPGILVAAHKVGRLAARAEAVPDDRDALAAAVARYALEREGFESRFRERFAGHLERWQAERASLAVYGAGEHTQFLFDLLPLRARVKALLDGDPAKQGGRFLGLPIRAPEALGSLGVQAVILSSKPFEDEMERRVAPLAQEHGIEVVRCYAAGARAA